MPQLTVVVPTFNERKNIDLLIDKLAQTLQGVDWEAVVVDDDSPDGTALRVRERAQEDRRLRCIQRIGRRGLSSAVIEGMFSSSAPYVGVIDADLQHDEAILPEMLRRLESGQADLVVGSRFAEGASVGSFARSRLAISRVANALSRRLVRVKLADPMAGFFMIRRDALDASARRLSATGFKILLDILASSPKPLRVEEIPFKFRERQHGESKLDALVLWEYLMLLVDKTIGRFVPSRFVLFGFVGAIGIIVHLATLQAAHYAFSLSFGAAQIVASIVAMTSNFLLNNALTYRDRRLKGWRAMWGLLSFYLVCSIGAVANIGVAEVMFHRDANWWLAGTAGALIGVVWNFAASSIFTWRPSNR